MNEKQKYGETMIDIGELSIEEKVGQLIIGGFDGISYNEDIDEMIVDMNIGGVILFKRNYESVKQLSVLCGDIKAATQKSSSCIPPFVSVDHEGGRVMRFGDPFTHFPSAMSISKRFPPSMISDCFKVMAKELSVCGINMSYAPLLDVNLNPDNPVISDRAFGDNSDIVYTYAKEAVLGIRECNVIPVGKHFPGHGNTNKDSHYELPVTCSDSEILKNVELVPFEKAVSELNIEALMTAHVMYPFLDDKNCATMSKEIISCLLKGELGFSGVVISDDLEMKAVAEKVDIGKNCIDALNAGVDILLICHDIKKIRSAVKSVISAVDDGSIDPKRIDDALIRVLSLKKRYKLNSKIVDIDMAESVVGCTLHVNLLKKILNK